MRFKEKKKRIYVVSVQRALHHQQSDRLKYFAAIRHQPPNKLRISNTAVKTIQQN